jgi:hypothetical protein
VAHAAPFRLHRHKVGRLVIVGRVRVVRQLHEQVTLRLADTAWGRGVGARL